MQFLNLEDAIHVRKENGTEDTVEFVVFRFVLDGMDKRGLMKEDKIVVERRK